MIETGLLSVTFRQLSPQKVVELCVSAELQSIEWGGDIHVPHGDLKIAKEVSEMTRHSGLLSSAYGSYYRLGKSESPFFEAVLDTAEVLEAPIVRVWAGDCGSSEADATYRKAILDDAFRIVEQASQRSIIISLEYHANTLTDSLDSTLDLLKTIDSPYFQTFWQPPHTADLNTKIHGLEMLLPWLTNVHVFHWHPQTGERFKLIEGKLDWQNYIDILSNSERNHTVSLEFVKHDAPEIFLDDAQTLKSLLESQ